MRKVPGQHRLNGDGPHRAQMLGSTADVGVSGSRGSGASLNAASTRSVWEGSSVSPSVFMLKHACICIHAHVITQTVATHLFHYNTCMQIPPPFLCLRKNVVLPPALGSEEKTADGQTDKAETSGPAVAPLKGPAPCPMPVSAGPMRCGTRFSARSRSGRRV